MKPKRVPDSQDSTRPGDPKRKQHARQTERTTQTHTQTHNMKQKFKNLVRVNKRLIEQELKAKSRKVASATAQKLQITFPYHIERVKR